MRRFCRPLRSRKLPGEVADICNPVITKLPLPKQEFDLAGERPAFQISRYAAYFGAKLLK
jgi:hypothetical protein